MSKLQCTLCVDSAVHRARCTGNGRAAVRRNPPIAGETEELFPAAQTHPGVRWAPLQRANDHRGGLPLSIVTRDSRTASSQLRTC